MYDETWKIIQPQSTMIDMSSDNSSLGDIVIDAGFDNLTIRTENGWTKIEQSAKILDQMNLIKEMENMTDIEKVISIMKNNLMEELFGMNINEIKRLSEIVMEEMPDKII